MHPFGFHVFTHSTEITKILDKRAEGKKLFGLCQYVRT